MTKSKLQNKTALVTGGIKRIGQALASALADEGVNLVLHYNQTPAGEVKQFCSDLQDKGVRVWACRADFSKPQQAASFFQQITGKLDPDLKIDFLINSAATFETSNINTVTHQQIQATLNINSIAPLILSQHFARQTRKGCIINFLDTRITHFDLAHGAYQLSKNMLRDITLMLAQTLAPHIRVNAVAPGLILPPPGQPASYLNQRHGVNLLNSHGKLADITQAVVFLLQQTFITGQILFIDGGQHIKGANNDTH